MLTSKSRVTIGLPLFNAEKYLSSALDSILTQSYTDFELLISDNASTDRTQEICQAYAARDQRVRYHRNETNLGASPNFNLLFQLSSTEYFKWAPYDDLLAPDFLARCVQVLDQNPAVVLCYSRAQIIDAQGAYEVDYDPGPDTSSPRNYERFGNLILHPEYAIQQMGVIRSDALKKSRLFGSYPSADEVFLAELALLGPFYEIPERLYIYRRHPAQSTQGKERTRIAFFDTSKARKILLPKWLYLGGCLDVIRRAPLSASGRARCYLTMARWLLIPAHFRALGKDLIIAAHQLVVRTSAKARLDNPRESADSRVGLIH